MAYELNYTLSIAVTQTVKDQLSLFHFFIAFNKRIQVTPINEDSSNGSTITSPRRRNPHCGHPAAVHEVAYGPVTNPEVCGSVMQIQQSDLGGLNGPPPKLA
jgi:hypothetical protein